MDRSKEIIKFYMLANKLKYKIRSGFIEIGIEKDRLESVAEHIYGCLILAITIDCEYNLNLDMLKVLKMLALHELEEIKMGDLTLRSGITKEEKIKVGKKCVNEITKGLIKSTEINNLLDEFNEHITKESIFSYHIDKIECDMQAKIYDLEGAMKYNKAREDLLYYGERANEIDKLSKTASDFWLYYDMPLYDDDPIFKRLIKEIQSIK